MVGDAPMSSIPQHVLPRPGPSRAAWPVGWPGLAWPVAWLLLMGDAAFLLVHLLHKSNHVPFAAPAFNLTHEGGLAENFQYAKEAFITGVLALQALRWRSGTFTLWALLFGYLTLDDSLALHERGGAALAATLPLEPAWGLRSVDLGELIAAAAVALAAMLMLAAIVRWGRANLRRVSWDLSMLLALLAVCGVGFDMLHVVAVGHGVPGMGIAEDGGEMAVMSLIAACVVQQARHTGRIATAGDRRSA